MTLTSNVKLNQTPSNPTLKDLIDLVKKDILLSLNAHHVGTVRQFDSATQTATVSINYKKTLFQPNAVTGAYEAQALDYPLVLECPVIVLGGGTAALTFPILPGDECLVLFNDRDLDNWFQGNVGAAVATGRLHSFSDGIVLVGLRSTPNILLDYDTTRAALRNGETVVGVGLERVLIANSLFTLNGLLQDLIDSVKDIADAATVLTVTCATPGNPSSIPVNFAAFEAAKDDLIFTAEKIEELLE